MQSDSPKPSVRPRAILGLVLILGFLFNVWHSRNAWSGPDGELYLEFAHLVRTPGYFLNPESFWGNYWPSGYAIFLAALGFSPESAFHSVALVNAVLNCLAALGCWFLTRSFGLPIRLTVVGFVLISPDTLWASRAVGYEALLSCLIIWSLVCAWPAAVRKAPQTCAALSGILFVLAVTVQSRVVILLPVLLYLSWRRGSRTIIAFLAGLALIGVPWLIRGAIAYRTFSLLTTNGPINVWIGSNPEATTGGYMGPPVTPNGYINGSIAFFKEAPYDFLDLALRRSARLFVPIADDPGWPSRVNALYSLWAFIFALALLAGLVLWWTGYLWRGPARMPAVAPLAISATLYLVTAVPFLIEPRYRMPMTPLLICVLVPTVLMAWQVLHRRLMLWQRTSAMAKRRGFRSTSERTKRHLECDLVKDD